jgi:hypothetical protein
MACYWDSFTFNLLTFQSVFLFAVTELIKNTDRRYDTGSEYARLLKRSANIAVEVWMSFEFPSQTFV